MEKSKLDDLLNKYYEAETNLEEEKSLKQYKADEYLEYLEELKTRQGLIQIEQKFMEETSSGGFKRMQLYAALSVAASLALILILGQPTESTSFEAEPFIVKNEKRSLASLSKEEQMAYKDAKKALLTISQKLNKAENQMNKIRLINAKNPIKM